MCSQEQQQLVRQQGTLFFFLFLIVESNLVGPFLLLEGSLRGLLITRRPGYPMTIDISTYSTRPFYSYAYRVSVRKVEASVPISNRHSKYRLPKHVRQHRNHLAPADDWTEMLDLTCWLLGLSILATNVLGVDPSSCLVGSLSFQGSRF